MTPPVLAEPIVRTVKRYICPFCSRGRSKEQAAVAHIGRCWQNPALRTCKTCVYLAIEPAEPDIGLRGAVFCDLDVDIEDPALDHVGIVTNCEKWVHDA